MRNKNIPEKENLYSSYDWSKFNLALKKYREKFVEYEKETMTNKKDPILVTIREKQTVEQALDEKKLEKDLELIERIENQENTLQQEPDSISKDNAGKLKPSLVMPYVITTKKEQTVEQAIRLTKVEHSNPLELIERIENEKS